MRDKSFIINSIKMDLHRVVTAAGDVRKELPRELISAFLKHADQDFDKTEFSQREMLLRQQLRSAAKELNNLQDPHKRLRWADDVLTIRCRL